MEELTWFSTPPSLLEQIMSAESVHPFHRGLVDMKERLQPTHHRHLFAFLHPAVVEEPLIAVQVALTKGIANSVDHILRRPTPLADPANKGIAAQSFQAHAKKYGVDSDDQERVDTAIFYSINSAQSALRGMDMGNMLIKRVVREIEENINATRGVRNLPAIVTFSTLSPIPGYTRWLSGEVEFLQKMVKSGATKMTECTRASSTGTPQSPVFGTGSVLEQERRFFGPVREAVTGYLTRHAAQLGSDEAGTCEKIKEMTDSGDLVGANAQTIACLLRLFRAPDPADAWWLDFTFTQQLEVPLLRSIAHYLFEEKKRKRILDPVGNFHVSNGAIMYRLNFQGNATPQGSHESACVMVNYLYDMNSISTNVQNYEVDKTVACGEQLTKLLTNED